MPTHKKYIYKRIFLVIVLLGIYTKTKAVNSNPHDSLSIVVPNIFTPNNDGKNDTWSILISDYGIILFDLQTTIYDRWGEIVFQTTNIHEVWLGRTPTGRDCNSDSYYYVISYTNSITNQQQTLHGFLQLEK